MIELYLLLLAGTVTIGAAAAASSRLASLQDPRKRAWLVAISGALVAVGILGQELRVVARPLHTETVAYITGAVLLLILLLQGDPDDEERP